MAFAHSSQFVVYNQMGGRERHFQVPWPVYTGRISPWGHGTYADKFLSVTDMVGFVTEDVYIRQDDDLVFSKNCFVHELDQSVEWLAEIPSRYSIASIKFATIIGVDGDRVYDVVFTKVTRSTPPGPSASRPRLCVSEKSTLLYILAFQCLPRAYEKCFIGRRDPAAVEFGSSFPVRRLRHPPMMIDSDDP
ncbi:hypothetical protein A0H81_08127 [Grifola frondosa]|uniref:Uncharacterized protein n=1 Tax=Grifola frondosa TaxID=5627 RepID=A0A1C7M5U6_GRIFR|nr:hypothetical protein A0H81_08127 [Grifola frondosa]